jgi:hypothetical protein
MSEKRFSYGIPSPLGPVSIFGDLFHLVLLTRPFHLRLPHTARLSKSSIFIDLSGP